MVLRARRRCDTNSPPAARTTVRGNITMFVALTKAWIVERLRVRPPELVTVWISSHKGQRAERLQELIMRNVETDGVADMLWHIHALRERGG